MFSRSNYSPGENAEDSHGGFRQTVQFYMIDFQTPLGKAIDVSIIALNLLYVVLFIINTYPISIDTKTFIWRLEVFVAGLFLIEYSLRLYGAPERWVHIKDAYSIIDLVAIVPALILLAVPSSFFLYDLRFIQIIRVLAVFRIFRFLRFIAKDHLLFGIISLEMLNVARLITTIIIIFFVYSGLFYFVENLVNPEVQNFGDAFYFTVVAVSTVGFGDIVPVSEAGRLVTVAMIISGIILIPYEASKIFRTWMKVSEKKFVVCPRCSLSSHDTDAEYCRKCGQELKNKDVESVRRL